MLALSIYDWFHHYQDYRRMISSLVLFVLGPMYESQHY